jgi:hypothetical protein
MRALLICLIFGVPLVAQSLRDEVALALRSGDQKRIAAVLPTIEKEADLSPSRTADLLIAAGIDQANLRRRCIALLAKATGDARDPLLQAAHGLDEDTAILALRALGRMRDVTTRSELLPLLDHASTRRADETIRCLFLGADEGLDSWMKKRSQSLADALAKERDTENAALLAHRYEDTLQYLSRRGRSEPYPVLVACLQSPHENLRRAASMLLPTFHRDRLLLDREDLLQKTPRDKRLPLMNALEPILGPSDRDIALRTLPEKDRSPSEEWLWQRLREGRAYLGPLAAPNHVSDWQLKIEMKLAARDQVKSQVLDAATDGRIAFTGADIDFALARVLMRPHLWSPKLTKTDRGWKLAAQATEAATKLTVGLGNAKVGLWLGRNRIRVRRIEIDFDERARPIEERMLDDEGNELAALRYGSWFDIPGGGIAPRAVAYRSPIFQFVFRFALTENTWHLSNAEAKRKTGKEQRMQPAATMKATATCTTTAKKKVEPGTLPEKK